MRILDWFTAGLACALVSCSTTPEKKVETSKAHSICEGNRSKGLVEFYISALTELPKGVPVDDVAYLSSEMNSALEFLNDHFIYRLASETYKAEEETHSFIETQIPKTVFDLYKSEEFKAAERSPKWSEVNSQLKNELLLIRLTDKTPYHFVLCRKGHCEGIEPLTQKKIKIGSQDGGAVLGLDRRGIVPTSPSYCPLCKNAFEEFMHSTGFDLGSLVQDSYFQIPNIKKSQFCLKAGLDEKCFEHPLMNDKCLDKQSQFGWAVATVPEGESPRSCFHKNLTALSWRSGKSPEIEKLYAESDTSFALLMNAAVKVSTEKRGKWIVKKFAFNPEEVCRYAKPTSDLLTH